MIKIVYHGLIHSGDFKAVSTVMAEWMKTEKLSLKIKLGGEEIVYEDEKSYFYCHCAMGEPLFLLEGWMFQTLTEVEALLRQLMQLCKTRGIASRFDYAQVNDEGIEISDQFHMG